MSFLNPVDICNRGLQHIGVTRIADFNEDSKAASECSFAYDKLRHAELRRNVWRFAIRRTAIRALTSTTVVIQPVLWSSVTTYTVGDIVSDASGTLWQSRARSNLNNAPGNAVQWETYCGPMTADVFDPKQGYFAGELVYETPGDGTYLVYMSLQNSNSQDPRAPTEWLDTTTYYKDQVVSYYAAWLIGTTYAAGNTVSYNGAVYVSLSAGNVGHEPDTSTTYWALVSATLAPPYYETTTTYQPGAFVTYLGVNYVCILASTANIPPNATYWVAQAAPSYYVSLMDFNLNNDPTASPLPWSSLTAYTIGNTVGGSDGQIYTALGSSTNKDPTTTTGYWSTAGVLTPWTNVDNFGKANVTWQQIGVAIANLPVVYPLGSGPVEQTFTRNAYRLPANMLRQAPQDPKQGSVSILGAPTGLMYDDYEMEGNYIVTREAQPIIWRFVADITDVTAMDDMFCEGLAAKVGLELCEILTQSTQKMAGIMNRYKVIMGEARVVDGIETGPTEPPTDDYITTRL